MHNKPRRHYRWLLVALMALLLVGGALTIAYAQSSSGFNLNSPASFPVDI
jgi:hypothetical protein